MSGAHVVITESDGCVSDKRNTILPSANRLFVSTQLLADRPTTIRLVTARCFSRKSRSVSAKPLAPTSYLTPMLPGCGASSGFYPSPSTLEDQREQHITSSSGFLLPPLRCSEIALSSYCAFNFASSAGTKRYAMIHQQ